MQLCIFTAAWFSIPPRPERFLLWDTIAPVVGHQSFPSLSPEWHHLEQEFLSCKSHFSNPLLNSNHCASSNVFLFFFAQCCCWGTAREHQNYSPPPLTKKGVCLVGLLRTPHHHWGLSHTGDVWITLGFCRVVEQWLSLCADRDMTCEGKGIVGEYHSEFVYTKPTPQF